jgi:predicted DNA-binding transcriptional regulator
MFREVEMKRKNQISFAATTWNVYLYILTSRDSVGVRDVWRELELSSPSLAQYHINKLLELGMIAQTQEGKYVAREEKRVETLRSFVLLYGKLVPRLVFYGALVAGILAFYIIFWPMQWNFRDLTVITVAVISIIAFFFEAYVQHHSLKKSVQKI